MRNVLWILFACFLFNGCEKRIIEDCPKDWCDKKYCEVETNITRKDCAEANRQQVEAVKKKAEDDCAQALENLTNIAQERRVSCGDYNFSWCAEYECGLAAVPGRLFIDEMNDDEKLRAKYVKVKDYLICEESFKNYLKCAAEFTPETHKPLVISVEEVRKKHACYREEYTAAALEVVKHKKLLGLYAFGNDEEIFSPRIYAVIDFFSYLRENDIDPKSVNISIQELVESFRAAYAELEHAWKKETDKDMKEFLRIRMCDIVSDYEYFDLPSPKVGRTKQQVQEYFNCEPPETSLFGSRIG